MQDFFDRHGKKFIVAVGIVLMLAFLLPSVPQFGSGANATIGTLDGTKVSAGEIKNSLDQLQLLRRIYTRDLTSRDGQMIPALAAAFGKSERVLRQLENEPETWFLLTREAELQGITPSDEALNEALGGVGIQSGPGELTQFDKINPTQQAGFREAMRSLFAVKLAFDHSRAGIVISAPAVKYTMALSQQKIDVRLVEFPVDNTATTQPITDAELQRQFAEFAAVDPGKFDPKTNPHGFGYRVPDRLKIQVIGLPYSELRRVAKAEKTDYAWDVEARKYYLQHQDEFLPPKPDDKLAPASTQTSTTQTSTTQSASAQATSQPASAPVVRPFEMARDEIVNRMIEKSVNDLRANAQAKLLATLQSDYDAWSRTKAASQPAKPDITSYEYVKAVADDIYKQLGVKPDTFSYADRFRSATEFDKLTGVGKARTFDMEAIRRGQYDMPGFGETLMAFARPLLAGEKPGGDAVLFRPGKPIDSEEGSYLYRVVEASPSHPAATLDDVRAQVEKDLKLALGFQKAKATTDQAVATAKTGGLATAAAGKPILTTGPFAARAEEQLAALSFTPELRNEFIPEAYKLLNAPDGKGPPVYGTIAMPRAGKVYLAELTSIVPQWRDAADQASLAHEIGLQLASLDRSQNAMALEEWLSRDQIAARLNYVVASRGRSAPTPAVPVRPNNPFQ